MICMYELCSNLVFIIMYILLDYEASMSANHSWVNISFSLWLRALTNQGPELQCLLKVKQDLS